MDLKESLLGTRSRMNTTMYSKSIITETSTQFRNWDLFSDSSKSTFQGHKSPV